MTTTLESVATEFLAPAASASTDWQELCEAALLHPVSASLRATISQIDGPEFPARLLNWIEPLLACGQARLAAGLAELEEQFPAPPFDRVAVEADLLPQLAAGWLWPVARPMVLELNIARLQGALEGATPEERFDDFVSGLRRPERRRELFNEYPVLARHLIEGIWRWTDFRLEVLRHLCEDHAALGASGGNILPAGRAVRMSGGAGDAHAGGRSVQIFTFESGGRLVYKPRPMAVDGRFQDLVGWVNALHCVPALKQLQVLDAGDHGWMEFVAAGACADEAGLRRFYERQGGWLALLYAIEATDFHCENLIAHGEHPVLVDLESLFHPRLEPVRGAGLSSQADALMAFSVRRVGLLPDRYDGVEISGLGGAAGQLSPRAALAWADVGHDTMRLERRPVALSGAHNRPRVGDEFAEATQFVPELLRGFRSVYAALMERRAELLAPGGPLARFRDDVIRVIVRPTQMYADLLDDSLHPEFLLSEGQRAAHLDRLNELTKSIPGLSRLVPAERGDLLRGDIPMFTTRADSRDVWTTDGERVPDLFDRSGWEIVRDRVSALSVPDRDRQEWFIRASLTGLLHGVGHVRCGSQALPLPATLAQDEDFLAAAVRAGDRLSSLALRDGDHANWVGLILVGDAEWALTALGLDLYGGLPGVALFLGYLGEVSGRLDFTELARATVNTVLQQSVEQGDQITNVGAFDGWGGIIYTLTHLGRLWNEPGLIAEARRMAGRVEARIEEDTSFDLINGVAGTIRCLLTLHSAAPSPELLATAEHCGEWLLKNGRIVPGGMAWETVPGQMPMLAGHAHGTAGIARVLLDLASITGRGCFRDAAMQAVAYERSVFSPERQNWPDLRMPDERVAALFGREPAFMLGWCHGAPGIGLARLAMIDREPSAELQADVNAALESTAREGFGGNHSLCHGDLGNLDFLVEASHRQPGVMSPERTRRHATAVLNDIRARGWRCGTPFDVETPALMNGLAGIGYELLRVAAPDRVPSVLLLDPPPARPAD
jgi:type 2 lantibiotic biosynthesis protein LanM